MMIFSMIDGDEEGIRFQKALAKCRNCGHIKMIHSFLNCLKDRCVDSKLDVTGKYKRCRCISYEPKDNLEFLEEKYNRKLSKRK